MNTEEMNLAKCKHMIAIIGEFGITLSGTGDGAANVMFETGNGREPEVVGRVYYISRTMCMFAEEFIAVLSDNISYSHIFLEAIAKLTTHWVKKGILKKETK